jgi:hypothetical protein
LNPNATLGLSIVTVLDDDEHELEQLARSLRAELLELDVDAVEPAAAGPAPDDARAVEALLTGALVVRLAQDTQAISSVVHTVRGWLGANSERRVRIELDGDVLELTGSSDEERGRIVEAWIGRHGNA